MSDDLLEDAIGMLKDNLDEVGRVSEWAKLMGYKDPKKFSLHFTRHFHCRPSQILNEVRLLSIIEDLQQSENSCMKIAWDHSLPDEKALYSFINYHLGKSPTKIRNLDFRQVNSMTEKFNSIIHE